MSRPNDPQKKAENDFRNGQNACSNFASDQANKRYTAEFNRLQEQQRPKPQGDEAKRPQ